MIESLISLFSIFLGVLSSSFVGYKLEKKILTTQYSIAGVFGSIIMIKSFSRFGFSPHHIVRTDEANIFALIINILFSLMGGCFAAFFFKFLNKRFRSS